MRYLLLILTLSVLTAHSAKPAAPAVNLNPTVTTLTATNSVTIGKPGQPAVLRADSSVSIYTGNTLGLVLTPASGIQAPVQALTDAATVTLACDRAAITQNRSVTLSGSRTLTITGSVSGMHGTLIVQQDAVGGRRLSLPPNSKVANGGAGTLTLDPHACDLLDWFYDGTTYFWTYRTNFR
jgi:hypothetical protein